MDALEAVRTRRSCRRFAARDVPRDLVEKVVDAGRLAATARNDQPWEFVVVTDPAARREIAGMTDYGPFIADAPVCIAVLCKDTKYYLEDGSAATQNILLAAHVLGLGACWVAGDKKPYAPKIVRLLGAPEGIRLVALVALGWPEGKLPNPPKRTLPEVLHWEKF
ncbi:MAG: nitroreductase family protein [Planctomycetota bacterium]|nr:nitroreductase family protein [Planctomycetota bacterium]